ncbi:MAG: tape measure protein [Lutibacter sp.]|nr:tape measure protein [Lutibacter sp.]
MAKGNGQITREDLITSDAEKVYTDLATKASTSLGEIVKAIETINKSQGKFNTTTKESIKLEKEKDALTKKFTSDLRGLQIAQEKVNLAIKNQTLANKQASKSTKENTKSTEKQVKATKTLESTFKSLLRSMVAFIGVRMFIQAIKDTFELVKKLDSLSFAMKAITTNAKDLISNQLFLNRITRAYGAEIVTTTERYINFLAAAKQSNVSLQDTQNIFETFTKVAGVLGKSTDDLRGIFLALEQMLSKGKVTTEELRRQLGERLPGAMGIMATSLKVTIPELDKMLKAGEVLSAEVLPEFARQVELSFGITNITKVKTLAAANIRFKNGFVDLVNDFKNGSSIVQTFVSIFDVLTSHMGDIVEAVFLSVKGFIAYKGIIITNIALTNLMAFSARRAGENQFFLAAGLTKTEIALGRLNFLLKKNALLIAVIAVTGLIFIINKLNVSATETAEALSKQNAEFISTNNKAIDIRESIENMADAYDKLIIKVNRSVEEQDELDRVLKALKDNMPDTITAINDSGDAISANTTKVRENIEAQRELSKLQASVNVSTLEKSKKALESETKALKDDLKQKKLNLKYSEDAFKPSQALIKQQTIQVINAQDLVNANKIAIGDKKREIQLNKDILSGQDLINIQKAKDDAKEAARLKAIADAEKAKIRNIENLQKEITELTAKQKLVDSEKKGSKITLDNLAKEIKLRQDLINEIKRSKTGGSGGSSKDPKQFANLENQIQAQIIQAEIDANNRIIEADETLYSEKINLLNENYYSEGIIIALQTKDKIDSIELLRKKDLDAGENKAKTNKYYDDLIKLEKSKHTKEILDLQFKLTQGLKKLGDDEIKKIENNLKYELDIIQNNLKEKQFLNQVAYNKSIKLDSSRASKKEARRIQMQEDTKAEEEAITQSIAKIDEMGKVLIDLFISLGIPAAKANKILADFRASILKLGDDAGKKLEPLEKWAIALDAVGKMIGKINEISKNASDARIADIQSEITAEEEKYDRLKELAGNDADTKKALDDELAAHIKILKAKEKKEKEKQWKIDQKVALAQAAINIALGITANLKKPFMIPFIAALGALELALIATTPMPKFAKGGIMGYDGQALINDGGKREFIERNGSIFSTDNKNAVVNLQKGDVIHKDLDALLNANIMHSIATDNKLDVSGLKNIMSENYSNLEGALTRVLKNNKSIVNLRTQKIDIPQALYKQSKLKW